MTMTDPNSLFAGARRAHMYDDSTATYPAPEEVASPTVIRDESPKQTAHLEGPAIPPAPRGEVAQITEELLPTRRRPQTVQAPGLWQQLLIKMGAAQAPPTETEVEDSENERIVRQSTWTRAMSVAVVNPKGQSAKTPLTLLLAGALAEIRGGGVAAWEATEVPGDLSDIAEGTPPRGLTELIAAAGTIQSAGTLAGYTAPQTSHAAVIGSVSGRDEMTPEEVRTVRDLLGTYYQIDVADTANNLQRPMLQEVLRGADAVVVPCVVNHKSVRGLQRALVAIERVPGLSDRTVLVVTHDGGPEDAEFSRHLTEQLTRRYRVRAMVEVPYDPAIRADGELTYSALQPQTRHTIRRVARHVVEAFNDAPMNRHHNPESE